jgi:protein SCO1/2
MNRRRFLASAGAVGTSSAIAGCLGTIVGDDSNTAAVLDEPDRPYESSDVAFPAWGQAVPDVTIPAALGSRDVALRDVEGPMLLTFFYSHCNTVCPVLISTLRTVHTHARNNGYSDEVSFFPVTFDPSRDTADRLRTYAEEMNVAVTDQNWEFLRPRSDERATTVVEDTFGVGFERTNPDDMDMYMFAHTALTLLANDGVVERAYQTDSPAAPQLIDDLRSVRNA